jgi:CHAT domain-containing protein
LAVDQAERWATWAAERNNVPELAEAHWRWITAVVEESHRRVFQAQKEHQLSQVQGLAARAGASLLAAGRGCDAAVALELGRAVLLTERMDRDRDGLEERLLHAGRQDLADRWRDVCERMSRMDRTAYRTIPTTLGVSTSTVRADLFAAAFTSAERVTHAEHERLLREIGGVPGCEDAGASPTYDDLRGAARDGPVVYLSVTEQGGHAIVVTDAPDPVVVELASLRAPDVDAHARRLLRAPHAHAVADELEAQLPWLWDALVRPLVAHLPPASLVTLIPVGALSQLPIHAAGAAPDRDGVWHDQTGGLVFRYAPNARVLLRAQAAAGAISVGDLQLLTVAVTDGPGAPRLQGAKDESQGVAAQFARRRTIRPWPATVTNVSAALDGCGIWHFACNGRHDLDEPLESCLLLDDGPLTLREIFARPAARGRLAVLSACQTAITDRTLLDEVIGFPGALLQNGIGGVVSSQTAVYDNASMLLVLRFFSRLRRGVIPARALAEAQAWLRCANNDQIHDAFPRAYPLPQRTGRVLAFWRGQQPFTEPHNWAVFSYSGH